MKADGFGPLTEEGYYHGCQGEPDAENSNRRRCRSTRQQPSISQGDLKYRRRIAAEIRRRYERVKGRTPEEAWLAVLADPEMPCTLWLDAARKITGGVQRNGADRQADTLHTVLVNGEARIRESEEALVRPMAGEILRGKKRPASRNCSYGDRTSQQAS